LCVNRDILAALAYFDLFDYPLTQPEIFTYLRSSCSHEDFTNALYKLTSENHVVRFDEFYSLRENYAQVLRRRTGNLKSRKSIVTAEKIAGLLSCFPFVRGIAVLDAYSKNLRGKNPAIEFFIITARNRLWLARSFVHYFKWISFPFKKQDALCISFYADEEMLQIKEKNIYTAMEVATLVPLRGIDVFQRFYRVNSWYKNFLPNHGMKVSYLQATKQPFLKKFLEVLFNNQLGYALDNILMRITTRKWEKTKQKKVTQRGIVLEMNAGKHYTRLCPENFQNKLIALYEQRLYALFRGYDGKIQTFY
jgi:hypothetical protein